MRNISHLTSTFVRNHFSLISALFVCAFLVTISFSAYKIQARADDINILTNPGCENGTAFFNGYQASLTTSSSIKRSGNASCKVTSTSNSYHIIESSQSFANPQKGQVFTATAWVRSDTNAGRKIYLSLREKGGSTAMRTVYGPAVTLTTQWQQLTNTFIVQSTGRTALDFQVVQNPSSRNQIFYVDDMIFSANNAPTLTSVPSPSVPPTPLVTASPSAFPASITPVPTAVSGNSPSGQSMPIGDSPGWKQIFAEDFTVDAPLGSWGLSCSDPAGADKVVYTGANNTKWNVYPDCYKDTYQKRPYRADQVLSVHDGVLDFYLHPVNGQPAGANPSPILNNSTLSRYQTYGRYTARFKVDNNTLSEYYVAWLLWPQNEADWQCAESDYPEGSLTSTTINGFHHYGCRGSQDSFSAPGSFTQWHTFTQEWVPGIRRYYLDGTLVKTSINSVYAKPERWQLQTETNGTGTHTGHLTVDWVSVYSYVAQ